MKKVLLASVIVLASVFAQAKMAAKETMGGARDSLDGCGLGWQVTESRTMIGTTTRGTTNAFVPPAFGMTSGTIGCEQIAFAKNDQEAASFVATNYQTLKSELAIGQGEYVSAMIQSFGCSSANVPSISSDLQKKYDSVVAPTQNATELFSNLKAEIGQCG